MNASFTTAVAGFGLALLCSACMGPFSEIKEQSYTSSAAANAADASGWIPAIVPDDATNIREAHNFTSNETWGCFLTTQAPVVRVLLGRLDAHKTTGSLGNGPRELFRKFPWWPGTMSTGSVEAWEFHEPTCPACGPSTVRVGFDPAGNTVCFHRNPW